jgi:cell division protein FtsW (lipid II flippase)
MFDDLDTAERKTDDEQTPADGEGKTSWWIGRWAQVIAGLVFCLLYFPFKDRFWSWQVAITLTYVVFMFCCTCGLAFKDSDDFFGNSEVQR